MQSSESPSDLTHSNNDSHIFRTLDYGQMDLIFDRFGHGGIEMGIKSDTLDYTPQRLSCTGWRTLHRDMIGGHPNMMHKLLLFRCHPLVPWTLDIQMMMSCQGLIELMWFTSNWMPWMNLRWDVAFFHHIFTSGNDMWPWRGPLIPLGA